MLYKFCAFIPYNGDFYAFRETIENLRQTIGFERVKCVLLFREKLYQLDRETFIMIDSLINQDLKGQANITYINADFESKIYEAISDCEIVLLINEGDAVNKHLIEYTEAFFDDNNSRCSALTTKDSAMPEVSVPFDGVKNLSDGDTLPKAVCQAAVLAKSVSNIDWSKPWKDTFLDMFLRAVMEKGCYGILGAFEYRSNSGGNLSSSMLLELINYSLTVYDEIPPFLINTINEYVDAQIRIPLEFDQKLPLLFKYRNRYTSSIEEFVEIINIENYYDSALIEGIYGCQQGIFSCQQVVKSVRTTLDQCANKPQQRNRFSVIAKLTDGRAELKFYQNKKQIKSIISDSNFGNFHASINNNTLSVKRIAPRSFYMVSCIIPVFNGMAYLREAIESVINQSLSFFEHIQLILVNNGSTDDTHDICIGYAEKYPHNILYVQTENIGVSTARNEGLQYAFGKYVSFLDADDKFHCSYLEQAVSYLEKNESVGVVAFPIEYFGSRRDLPSPSLNFRFMQSAVIDLETNPEYIQFSVCSAVIRRDLTDTFNVELSFSEDAEFMHRVLLKTMKYATLNSSVYMYRTGGVTCKKTLNEAWYNKNKLFGSLLIKHSLEKHGIVTNYTQHLIIHELLDSAAEDIGDVKINTKGIFECMSHNLQYVDDKVIMSSKTLGYWLKLYLLKLKYGLVEFRPDVSRPGFYVGCKFFEPLEPIVFVTSLNECDASLNISGYYFLPCYEDIIFKAVYNGQVYDAQISEDKSRDILFLGEAVHTACVFDISIPYSYNGVIEFFICAQNINYPLVLKYEQGLSELPGSFFVGKSLLVAKTQNDNSLSLSSLSARSLTSHMCEYLKNIPESSIDILESYIKLYPLMSNVRIWIYFDGTPCGNARRLFEYAVGKGGGNVDHYYIIDEKTPDGVLLKETGAVVDYGSDMHKLMLLFAEKVIVSDMEVFCPFGQDVNIFEGLLRYKLIYLPQETIDEQIKGANTRLSSVFVSSYAEQGVLEGEKFNVETDGRPEYDGLLGFDERKIIFMPSWREELYLGDTSYNSDFAESEYCKKISELLCDERLSDAMEEYGYSMSFVPHPKIYLQIADIDMYEDVTVVSPTESKCEVFESGSLLITDQMDALPFLYTRKPVIYYNFGGSCKPKYVFGDRVSNVDELVDLIIIYMENSCQMTDEYKQKVDAFFVHADNKNCERIYNKLLG